MRYFLTTILIFFGMHLFSQERYSQEPEQDTLFLNGYGEFEDFAIMLDRKKIERDALTDYPGAWLDQLYLGYRQGTLYFKTAEHPIPQPDNTNAYFINGRQVTFPDIRRTKPEAYTRIEKSQRDTIIGDVSYKGSIRVETAEDFFAQNISLLEFLGNYPNLSPDHTIVQLQLTGYRGILGYLETIHNNPRLYHINPQQLLPVKAGRIRLAEGILNIVHLVDTSWTNAKARFIFEDPSRIDIAYPCYLTDFDTGGDAVFSHPELPSVPFYGTDSYLRRMSEILGLPADKGGISSPTDSIDIEFMVTKDGMLTDLKTTSPEGPEHERILHAIKRRSCDWSTAIIGGRPILHIRKMTIYYTVDRNGNILSLDSLKFR